VHHRLLLNNFEAVVFDNQSQQDVEEFLGEVLGVLMPFFAPNIPDLLNLDRTDPFCTIRLLQRLYTKFLAYASTNSAYFTANIFDHARSWTSGGTDEFTQFILELQKMRSELPDSLRPTVPEKLLVDLVIASLKKDPNLNAMHAILRSDFIKGQCVTLSNVESAVISVLKDVTVSTISAAREEPVAATAFFSQQKKRTYQAPRGKPTGNQSGSQSRSWGNQSRSPIKKTIPRLSSAVWAKIMAKCPKKQRTNFFKKSVKVKANSVAVAAAAVVEVAQSKHNAKQLMKRKPTWPRQEMLSASIPRLLTSCQRCLRWAARDRRGKRHSSQM
jgi:hypothetical protein